MIVDAEQRSCARDQRKSVIVQAPAGSGKTELLMQRYLVLLAEVEEPEQILAVTFTRKAAAEMRSRVLNALRPAIPDSRLPETALLAEQVLRQNDKRGWRLLDYPARLRIRTFDSVNSWLSGSAPVSDAQGTALGVVTEQPAELYELAARRALELVTEDDAMGGRLSIVLRHLDNRADRFIGLMARMLERRDQWLPLTRSGQLGADARAVLEAGLRELVERELNAAAELLGEEERASLLELVPFAAGHLCAGEYAGPICAWRGQTRFPAPDPAVLEQWQGLAEFCLVQSTSGGPAFRKTVNKKNGFPTPKDGGDKAMTDAAKQLLAVWAGNDPLALALDTVRSLPEPAYSDAQWEALEAMIGVLPVVAAQLELVFAERGETDYIQIARKALDALGADNDPTRLALRLDYQVQHILIDEFQDTSRTQYELLLKLTAGWTAGDGRTLMVVGDPMQSIYRFRQADVSLFLELWERGLGDLRLETITLESNFRSAPAPVDWVNSTFAQILPAEHDQATGAVRFAPAVAARDPAADARVVWHRYEEPARVDEARDIGALVQQILNESDNATVGILVRTRNQARLIAPQLRARGIVFAGEGLERPGETAIEQDLIALTRALSHSADRTAWLALLRAPWCGLTLDDLEQLCGSDWQRTVREQMADPELLAKLSSEGRARVATLTGKLHAIMARKCGLRLRDWIEGAWQQLGGPAATENPRDLDLAEQFFTCLDEYDEGGDLTNACLLHERLAEREERNGADAVRVHLLTLFKAKGLEYDVVVLPALDGITRGDDKQVLAWHEYPGPAGETRHLVAPIEAEGDVADPLQTLIRNFDREQASNERDRLLYVAATRAKQQLHLFAALKRNSDDAIAVPRKGSLLERIWPVCAAECAAFRGAPGSEERREAWVQPKIRRFASGWSVPAPPPGLDFASPPAAGREPRDVTYDWAGSDAMRVGSVVHRCLQHIAEQTLTAWHDRAALRRMLAEEGVADAGLDAAVERACAALEQTLADEQGRWILRQRPEAACEFPVTATGSNGIEHLVIDRTFVASDGTRWIIDYKTSSHEGGNLDAFLANEVDRYREQLETYRTAMQLLEPQRAIKAALYFPLLGEFREITAASEK